VCHRGTVTAGDGQGIVERRYGPHGNNRLTPTTYRIAGTTAHAICDSMPIRLTHG
jgi:hypothetical protein